MNKDKLYELILDYLDENLDSSQLVLLKSELKEMGYDINDLSALQKLVNEMDAMPVPEPSEKMSESFYAMLEQKGNEEEELELIERVREFIRSIFQPSHFPRLAYATFILLFGWIIGYWFTPQTSVENQINQMSSEMQSMREVVMVAMMDKPLASDRLKAVNMVKNAGDATESVIQTLLNTLNNDTDANVRMAAVETLLAFANQDLVRSGLKESIIQQNSPLVQITLVDGLVAIQDKTAIPIFENLISNNDVHQLVKDRSREGITKLI